ncbi:hypothetical protein BgiMline_002834 [Biomphalaria glabrata]|nr:hypothetical protein BgiMline_011412 [Biomphalaria glabrata]
MIQKLVETLTTHDTQKLVETLTTHDTQKLLQTLTTHDTQKLVETLTTHDTQKLVETLTTHDTQKLVQTLILHIYSNFVRLSFDTNDKQGRVRKRGGGDKSGRSRGNGAFCSSSDPCINNILSNRRASPGVSPPAPPPGFFRPALLSHELLISVVKQKKRGLDKIRPCPTAQPEYTNVPLDIMH